MAGVGPISISNFLTVYGGEVINAYNEMSQLKDRLIKRTISSGKSASFPTFSTETAKLHDVGEDIFDSGSSSVSSITSGEKTVVIDKLLYAAQFVDNLDEAKAHYDIRGSLAAQAGAALATKHDQWLLAAMVKDATTHTHTHSTGMSATAKFSSTDELLAMIEQVAAKMDLASIPDSERVMVLRPYEFYQLLNSDGAISSDFNSSGDRSKGRQSFHYMGFEFLSVKAQKDYANLNAGQQVASDGPLYFGGNTPTTDHSFDGSLWYATAFHKQSAATLTLKGVTAEANYIPERNGTLLNAKTALGVDTLRPEGIFRINADN